MRWYWDLEIYNQKTNSLFIIVLKKIIQFLLIAMMIIFLKLDIQNTFLGIIKRHYGGNLKNIFYS